MLNCCLSCHRLVLLSSILIYLIPTLPLHIALMPDHLPDVPHVLIEDPDSLYPLLHLYLTVPPNVKMLPVLFPLEGVPGSPQSITKTILNVINI